VLRRGCDGGASRHGGSEPDAHLSQVHGGHAAQEAGPCAERQKRRRRAGATSSFNPNPSPTPVSQPALSRARSPTPDPQPGDDIETKIDAEDRMIPPEDIQRVRKLTDEEEQLLRDHVGLGTGGDVLHVGSIFPRSAGTISFFITFIITIGQFHPIMFPMQSVIKDSAAVWVLRLGGGAGPGVTGANTELREHGGDNRGVVK